MKLTRGKPSPAELDVFRVGDWRVEPHHNHLIHTSVPGHEVRIDPKVMQVLVYLAEHAGDVVDKKTVVHAIWEGADVTDEVLTNAIWELRKAFGDDAKKPQYIQTIPKKGYRLIAPVSAGDRQTDQEASSFFVRVQEVARRHGVEFHVVGSMVEAGGRIHLQATIYNAEESSRPARQAGMEDGAEELFLRRDVRHGIKSLGPRIHR